MLAAFGLVLGIVALAGFVDAYTFLQFKGLFVSFMSGNTVGLGVAVAQHNSVRWQQAALVISLFVGGVVLGTLLHNRVGNRWSATVLLGLVAALLLLPYRYPALTIGSLTLAMGLLNASVHRIGEVQTNLTFFTGALVRFGTGLANLLSGQPAEWGWLWQLSLWLSFLGGALAGATAVAQLASGALLLAAGGSLALAGLAGLARGMR